MKPIYAAVLIGVLAIGAYLVVNATSNTPSSCAGDWTDWINPACILQGTVAGAENELNTLVIILVLGIVAIVALVTFGSSSAGIAGALSPSFKI